MTQELIDKSESLIEDIDSKGGMLVCIEEGWIQSQIMDSAYKYQKEVESGERIIVGVNEYLEEEKTKLEEITKVENKSIEDQIRRLSNLKEKRGDVSQHLDILEQMASADNENLMPSIINAVSAKVTIGEICNSLRKVWGEYRPKEIL
jgi:methylmalonyl-CoA mutase N-terminal domain/subunit